MPKINEILLILEVFQYATSLDLNMGYYHIQPSENASKLCMIITLWRKYHYKRLPIGIANYPKFCQHKTDDLFNGFEFIRVYIYGILFLIKGDWKYNVHNL